jgi:hypothetical protein
MGRQIGEALQRFLKSVWRYKSARQTLEHKNPMFKESILFPSEAGLSFFGEGL